LRFPFEVCGRRFGWWARRQSDHAIAIEDIIADDENNLGLVKQKLEAGRAPRTDVLIVESQLTNDRALLPPLQQLLAVAEGSRSGPRISSLA
jgi:outer membrane protein TolC